MSDPIATPPAGDVPPGEDGEVLQFDQAEFATPAAERPTCSVCHQPIPEEYYEINQKVMCPRCRHGVEAAIRGGSPAARFVKATALGIGAAIVGAIFYYAFVRATGANWSLISILVGLLVGRAVRKGTGNRGGRLYQLMAVFLTYSSIVAMNVPLLFEALANRAEEKQAAAVAAREGAQGAKPDAGAEEKEAAPARPDAGAEEKEAAPAQADAGKAEAGGPREGPKLPPFEVLVILVIFFYKLPVLEVMQSPIAGLIYGFALWEAWKINQPLHLVFNGPFRLRDAAGGPEEVVHES